MSEKEIKIVAIDKLEPYIWDESERGELIAIKAYYEREIRKLKANAAIYERSLFEQRLLELKIDLQEINDKLKCPLHIHKTIS